MKKNIFDLYNEQHANDKTATTDPYPDIVKPEDVKPELIPGETSNVAISLVTDQAGQSPAAGQEDAGQDVIINKEESEV